MLSRPTVGLTGYAVMFRYPGDYEDITAEEYREALHLAQIVYRWAVQMLSANDDGKSAG